MVIMKYHCYFDFTGSLISDLYEYDIPILNVVFQLEQIHKHSWVVV